MNLQEETERTENEGIVQIPSLTRKVNGPGSDVDVHRLNLRFLCSLL
jgi:hypothetical protein